jgi:beta-methylarginine biosynthesis bifunctional aminotransferase
MRGVSPLALTDDWRGIYVVQSMSKNFGAPGLRIGWIVSAPERIEPLAGELEREHIAISGVTQHQAAALLARGNAALVDSVVERRRAILDELVRHPRLGFREPRGGALIAIDVPVDDIELFADTLMVEHGIVVVTSGHYEGATGAPFIRFPLGIPPEVSRQAIRAIARLLEEFRA